MNKSLILPSLAALLVGTLLGAAPTPTTPPAPAAASAPATASAPAGRGARGNRGPRVVPPADVAIPRDTDRSFMTKHTQYLDLIKKSGDSIDLYFEGDSITDGWHQQNALFQKAFGGWHPGNFGVSSDRTEHTLWRLQNGELDGIHPKAFVIMIGTNNSGDSTPEQIAAGVTAIVKACQDKNPNAKVLLLAIFPRGAGPTDRNRLNNIAANKILAKLDDGKKIKFLDISDKFLDANGMLLSDIFRSDNLHPVAKGYQIWADAIVPVLTEMIGPPATAPAAQ